MGEEAASVSAVEIAARRIARRPGRHLPRRRRRALGAEGRHPRPRRRPAGPGTAIPISVWARPEKGGGAILGSVGAFLVLEAREHAEARGKALCPARLGALRPEPPRTGPGDRRCRRASSRRSARRRATARSRVISGANGILRPTSEERDWLPGLKATGAIDTVRAMPNMLGACVEATFPSMVALAALSLSRKAFYRSIDDNRLRARGDYGAGGDPGQCMGVLAGRGHGTGSAGDVEPARRSRWVRRSRIPRSSRGGDHRHRRRHVARRRHRRELAGADRRPLRASSASPASRPSISARRSPARSTSSTRTPRDAQARDRRNRHRRSDPRWPASARRATSRGRSSPRSRRSSSTGRRGAISMTSATPQIADAYDRMCAVADGLQRPLAVRARHVRLRRRAARRPLRHQGLADHADHRLRLGRDRHPARRRGDPARRHARRRSASAPTAR